MFDIDLFPSGERKTIAGLLAKNLLGKDFGSGELSVRRKDGDLLDVEIMSHPIRIGSRDLVLGVVRDVSMRKKAEEETEELKRELHHAQKMDAIGRLAGGIAHDFNNLLAGIMGYAGLLRERMVDLKDDVGTVEKILTITKQAANLTAQLLAFARKGKYRIEPVDLHGIVDEVVELLAHTIDRRIVLEKQYNAPMSVVSGDRSQIYSALLNLGVNARDALPEGGTITFTTEIISVGKELAEHYSSVVDPGSFLKITVRDNGIGMDYQTRSQIFEPFFTTKKTGKGTGLGLASVYGAINLHKGFIDVWSEPEKGTVFTVCLPLFLGAVEKETSSQITAGTVQSGGMVLVVDDVDMIREVAEEVLTSEGYEVAVCCDGEEALQWFSTNHEKCDLVLLDLTMPGMSGGDCFREMKKINPALRVIISSGHARDREVEMLCNEGATMFLQKPFEIEVLTGVVAKVLGNAG